MGSLGGIIGIILDQPHPGSRETARKSYGRYGVDWTEGYNFLSEARVVWIIESSTGGPVVSYIQGFLARSAVGLERKCGVFSAGTRKLYGGNRIEY